MRHWGAPLIRSALIERFRPRQKLYPVNNERVVDSCGVGFCQGGPIAHCRRRWAACARERRRAHPAPSLGPMTYRCFVRGRVMATNPVLSFHGLGCTDRRYRLKALHRQQDGCSSEQ